MAADQPAEPILREAHSAAIAQVNRWRGRCIELFARAEQELAAAVAQRVAGRSPTSINGRIRALEAVEVPTRLNKTFDTLRALSEHRNLIVHARSTVWINDRQQWLWAFCFTPSGKDRAEQLGFWTMRQAEQFEQDLGRTVQSLASQLARLPPIK